MHTSCQALVATAFLDPGMMRECAKQLIACDCNSLGMSAALAASHVLFLPELWLQFLALSAVSLCILFFFVSLLPPFCFFFSLIKQFVCLNPSVIKELLDVMQSDEQNLCLKSVHKGVQSECPVTRKSMYLPPCLHLCSSCSSRELRVGVWVQGSVLQSSWKESTNSQEGPGGTSGRH